MNVRELIQSYPPKSKPIIHGLLNRGDVSGICGASGKSLLALDLAIAVASGQDFLGMKTEKSRVLYFMGEMRPSIVSRRIVDIMRARGIDPNIGDLSSLFVSHQSCGSGDDVVRNVRSENFELIVVDSGFMLNEGTREGDEEYLKIIRSADSPGRSAVVMVPRIKNGASFSPDVAMAIDKTETEELVFASCSRSQLSIDPFKIEFKYPLFRRVSELTK